jgi:hypothetical protein
VLGNPGLRHPFPSLQSRNRRVVTTTTSTNAASGCAFLFPSGRFSSRKTFFNFKSTAATPGMNRASCPGFIINGHIELTPLTFPLCSGRPKCAWLLLNRWRRRRERKRERERDEREPQRSRGLPMLGKKREKCSLRSKVFFQFRRNCYKNIYISNVLPRRARHMTGSATSCKSAFPPIVPQKLSIYFHPVAAVFTTHVAS